MPGFLQGLGDIAGGAAPELNQAINQYFQVQQQNKDATNAGLGVYAMLGIDPPQQQQQGGLGSILGGLMGGGQGQQAQQQQAPPMSSLPQTPVQQPQIAPPQQLGQGGQARSPMPVPQPAASPQQATPAAAPNAPVPSQGIQGNPAPPAALQGAPPAPGPPVAVGQPKTAQPGVTAPGQSVPVPGPSPAAQPTAQPQQPPAQQAQQQASAVDKYKDMFDYPTLVRNLVNTPNMNPTKLGKIISSDGFKNMLTQEGLAQYRAAGLGIREQNAQTAQGNLGERTREDKNKDTRIADNERAIQQARQWGEKFKVGQQTITGINKDFQTKSAAINAAVQRGDKTPEDAQKEIEGLSKDKQTATEKVQKDVGDPPALKDEGSGGQDNLAEQAKAAIMRGAPKDAVLKRLKEMDPNADVSGF